MVGHRACEKTPVPPTVHSAPVEPSHDPRPDSSLVELAHHIGWDCNGHESAVTVGSLAEWVRELEARARKSAQTKRAASLAPTHAGWWWRTAKYHSEIDKWIPVQVFDWNDGKGLRTMCGPLSESSPEIRWGGPVMMPGEPRNDLSLPRVG